jgi:hypothetical protein
MKISEAINVLKKLQEEAGDVDLVVINEADGGFFVEHRDMEIVELPIDPEDESDDAEMMTVVAMVPLEDDDADFMDESDLQ